jgi:hypothetical protein
MGDVVNLRRARKARLRAEREWQAEANRLKHGRPKHERERLRGERRLEERRLDGAKLTDDTAGQEP